MVNVFHSNKLITILVSIYVHTAPEVSGLLREGRPRPIAEQMKEAQKLAGERQAPSAPKRAAPDRGDR